MFFGHYILNQIVPDCSLTQIILILFKSVTTHIHLSIISSNYTGFISHYFWLTCFSLWVTKVAAVFYTPGSCRYLPIICWQTLLDLHISVPHQAVTKAKLGYDPLEVNPEDMVRFAMEQPQVHEIESFDLLTMCYCTNKDPSKWSKIYLCCSRTA